MIMIFFYLRLGVLVWNANHHVSSKFEIFIVTLSLFQKSSYNKWMIFWYLTENPEPNTFEEIENKPFCLDSWRRYSGKTLKIINVK